MFDVGQFDVGQIRAAEADCLEEKRFIGMEIHSLDNMARRYMDHYGHVGTLKSITGTNGWILGVVAHSRDCEIFQRDLEEKFGITRSTVSKVVNLMVRKGLLERSPVEYDARLKKLSLTEKSKELLSYMGEDHENMETVLFRGFSEEEKAQMHSYISRMKGNLKNKFEEAGVDMCGCFPCGREE